MSKLIYLAALSLALIAASITSAAEAGFSRVALCGVWEITAIESAAPRGPCDPESLPNNKFCFSLDVVWPGLGAELAADSADGLAKYYFYLVAEDVLVIRREFPGAHAYQILSLSADKLVWVDGLRTVTLRRIAKVWREKAPRVRLKFIPIKYSAR